MICQACGRDVLSTVILGTHHTVERPEPHYAPCGRRCIGGGIQPEDRREGELTLEGALLRAHRRSGCEVCGRSDSREPAWAWRRTVPIEEAP